MNGNGSATRRSPLKAGGAAAAVGLAGITGARTPGRGRGVSRLRVFSERSTAPNARDVNVQGNPAFVATGDGVTVFGFSDPLDPERVGAVDVPGVGVLRLHDDRGEKRPDVEAASIEPRDIVRGRNQE